MCGEGPVGVRGGASEGEEKPIGVREGASGLCVCVCVCAKISLRRMALAMDSSIMLLSGEMLMEHSRCIVNVVWVLVLCFLIPRCTLQVNLLSGEKPEDLYSEVAKLVSECLYSVWHLLVEFSLSLSLFLPLSPSLLPSLPPSLSSGGQDEG